MDPITVVDGRVYAARLVTLTEARTHDTLRERQERWT